jgi:serpin B
MILSLVATSNSFVVAAEGDVGDVVAGNNEFAFDLYAKLAATAEESDNVVFSPYSISTAFAMTYAGARGDTATEMADTLHFSLPQSRLHPAFAKLSQEVRGSDEKRAYELVIANRLWPQRGFPLEPDFTQIGKRFYGAEPQALDFSAQAEQSRQTINAWISDQTRKKIPELFPPGTIDRSTALVLTNAIYFLGDWLLPFKEQETKELPFYLNAQDSLKAPLMHQTRGFSYAETEQAQILQMFYKGRRLSMLVVLPKEKDGIGKVEASLDAETLNAWLEKMAYRRLDVYLPRFKTSWGLMLNDTLAKLGMRQAFTSSADFSGISRASDLFISAVMHKAYVHVNEKGTEAAAATGIVIGKTSVPRRPTLFRADHPFLYLIRDNQTGSILFAGRVSNPTSDT